jgi:hypothetical protein
MPAFIRIISHPPVIRDGHVTCSADYLVEDDTGASSLLHRVAFRFQWQGAFTPSGGEAFVTVGLLPAMKLGLPLVSDAPVAPGFKETFSRLQDIILAWFPGNPFSKIGLTAPERPPLSDAGRGVAALFSGGVDSFHTAHRRSAELDRLIYIEGFDTDLHHTEYRALVRRHLTAAAQELGTPMTLVETDARLFLDKYAKWGIAATTVSGAVLQLFSPCFKKVYAPSSHRWEVLHKLADGYLLTRQYSLRDQELVVDSMDMNRQGKVAALASCPAAFKHLRVCWGMPPGRLNCGTCEKCLRTMVALQSVGLLAGCDSLPKELDWDTIAALELGDDRHLRLWEMTRRATTDPTLYARQDGVMTRARTTRAALWLWEAGKHLTQAASWPALAKTLGKPLLLTQWRSDPQWLLKKCRHLSVELRKDLWAKLQARPPGLWSLVLRGAGKNKKSNHP